MEKNRGKLQKKGREKTLKIAKMMHNEREKMTFGWASNSAKKF